MCTTIKVESQEGFVLARTMDFEAPLVFNGLYIPKDYHYAMDLEGNKLISKYKAMGLAFYNTIPLKDGVNEYGLAGSTNYFHTMDNHSNKVQAGKINLSSLHYLNYALTNYKNVDELVEDIDNIHISEKDSQGNDVICPDFHHMFIDRSGKCVVVEPKNKKYIAIDNPYGVMTNSPAFERHVKKLMETLDLRNIESFNGAKNLPGGYDPKSRFVKAFYLLKTELKAINQKEALVNAYNIMDAMSLPKGFIYSNADKHHIYTRYISAYDTKNCILTARSFSNPRIYYAEFDDFKSDKAVFFDFNMDFTMDKFDIRI